MHGQRLYTLLIAVFIVVLTGVDARGGANRKSKKHVRDPQENIVRFSAISFSQVQNAAKTAKELSKGSDVVGILQYDQQKSVAATFKHELASRNYNLYELDQLLIASKYPLEHSGEFYVLTHKNGRKIAIGASGRRATRRVRAILHPQDPDFVIFSAHTKAREIRVANHLHGAVRNKWELKIARNVVDMTLADIEIPGKHMRLYTEKKKGSIWMVLLWISIAVLVPCIVGFLAFWFLRTRTPNKPTQI